MLLRPGVTGLAQVQLPADTDLDSVRTKLAYDLYYLQNMGLWLDLRIFGATVFKMVGAPFIIRKCFGFPLREVVESHYRELDQLRKVRSERIAVNGHPNGVHALTGGRETQAS